MIDLSLIEKRFKNSFKDFGVTNAFIAVPMNSPPPPGSYYSYTDRLAIPIQGIHSMIISSPEEEARAIKPVPGDVTFMPRKCWNHPDWINPVEVLTFIFQPDHLILNYNNNQIEDRKKILMRFTFPHVPISIYQIMELLKSTIKENNVSPKIPYLIQALIIDLIKLVEKEEDRRMGDSLSRCRDICSYIREYYSEDCSRETIADIFSLTPNYISNLFRKNTGYSFTEYVNQVRIKQSCLLLRESNATLDEIAASCGFSSTAYFCRVFRKVLGKRPGEIRNS